MKIIKRIKKSSILILCWIAVNVVILNLIQTDNTIKRKINEIIKSFNLDAETLKLILPLIGLTLFCFLLFLIIISGYTFVNRKKLDKRLFFLMLLLFFQFLSGYYFINLKLWNIFLGISFMVIAMIYIPFLLNIICILLLAIILSIIARAVIKIEKIDEDALIIWLLFLSPFIVLLIVPVSTYFNNRRFIKKIENNKNNKKDKKIENLKELEILNFKTEQIKIEFIKNIYSKEKVIYKKVLTYSWKWYLKLVLKYEEIIRKEKIIILDNFEGYFSIKELNEIIKNNSNNKYIIISKDSLINNRESNLKVLKKQIDSNVNSILLTEDWGNGKTYFIKKFMENYTKNYEFIYIKVPYFNKKEDFRARILSEISRIFKKNRIITVSSINLMNYFNIDLKFSILNIAINKLFFGGVEEYSEIILDIKKSLAFLKNRIVIILDDFDRVENKKQILEVLSFIGELNVELSENITLVTLSSYKRLVKMFKEGKGEETAEGEKYLEKYFDKKITLSEPNFNQLVDFFSDIYFLNEKRSQILKDIVSWIKGYDRELLSNNRVNFRNVERIVKEIKETIIQGVKENDVPNFYEDILIIWMVIEYLIPDYWEKIKKIEINLENSTKSTNEKEIQFYNELVESYIDESLIKHRDNSESKKNICKSDNSYKEFIYSSFNSVKKYKLLNSDNPMSYYWNLKEEMINDNENQSDSVMKGNYNDYKKVNEIFRFNLKERKKIFSFFMSNKNISQCEVLKLMAEYNLRYEYKYKNSVEFFKKLKETRKIGEIFSEEQQNGNFYIFLKKLLLTNGFIDISNKINNLIEKEEELYSESKKTGKFLISKEERYDFFKPFLLDRKDNNEEYRNFIEEVHRITKIKNITGTGISPEQKGKNDIEDLQLKLLNPEYLKDNLKKNAEGLQSLKKEIENIKNKYGIEDVKKILEFLKEDQCIYEIWKEYFEKIEKE